MLLIWKPPALLIIFSVLTISTTLMMVTRGQFPVEHKDIIAAFWVFGSGICIMIVDLIYRESNLLDLFDLDESTLFFIIPTWLVGAPLALFGFIAIAIASWTISLVIIIIAIIGIMVARTNMAKTITGELANLLTMSWESLETSWDYLEGWQRGIIGTLFVLIACSIIFWVLSHFV